MWSLAQVLYTWLVYIHIQSSYIKFETQLYIIGGSKGKVASVRLRCPHCPRKKVETTNDTTNETQKRCARDSKDTNCMWFLAISFNKFEDADTEVLQLGDAEGIWCITKQVSHHDGHRPARSEGNVPLRYLHVDRTSLLNDAIKHHVPTSCLVSKLMESVSLPSLDGEHGASPQLLLAQRDLRNTIQAERDAMFALAQPPNLSQSAFLLHALQRHNDTVYVVITTRRVATSPWLITATEVQLKMVHEGVHFLIYLCCIHPPCHTCVRYSFLL